MFKKMTNDDISCFSLIVIPIYMAIHLYFLTYFQHLWSLSSFKLNPTILNDIFQVLATPLSYLFIFLGLFFWLAPRVLIPLCLIIYWLVQAPNMNALNWHDQHVAFLTFMTLAYYFFKREKEENFPLRRFVLIFLAMFYFGAGLGKLHSGGLAWMDGHTSQYRFLQYFILFDAKFGLMIAENFLLCKVVSIVTVIFEICFPLCLFIRRLERPFLWASLLFLTTIYITMKINFFLFLAPVYLVFLPWGRITPFMKEMLPRFLTKKIYL